MMGFIRYLFLIYLLTLSGDLDAQKINEDSLLMVASDPKSTNVDLIQAHNKLARFYLRNDTLKANFHLEKLEGIAILENDTTALIMAGDLRVRQFITNSEYDQGELRVREMLRLSLLINKPCLLYTSPSPRD